MSSLGQTSLNFSRHLGGVALNGSLGACIVALALAAIVVLGGVFGVFASVFGGSLREGQPKEVIDKLVATHTASIDDYEKRFNNRSIFYKPPMPVIDRPRAEPRPEPAPQPVDTGPKIPATYTGPSIAWVIGSDVYFNAITQTLTEKYLRIGVGEERSGLKVINIDNMPRTVHVGFQGGEYDVKVFGESSLTATLFPTTPKPSAFVPGFIAVDPPPATSPEEATVIVEEAPSANLTPTGNGSADEDGGRASQEDPRRNRRPRGERPKAQPQTSEDNPDSGDKKNPYEPKPAESEPKGRR